MRIATGKSLVCTGCVGPAALSSGAKGPTAWGHLSGGVSPVVTNSSSNVSVSRLATGIVCVEVTGVDLTKTVPAIALDYTSDDTGATSQAHAEYGSACGTNGFAVVTYLHTLGTGTEAPANEAFVFVLP